jgi:hypothetical protein
MASARTLIGSFLILIGFLAIYFATPVAIPLGALATLLATWAAVILLAGGTFLILKLSLRVSILSILAAALFVLPISIIYMTPLPGDSQILIGSLIALVAVLLIRFHKRTNRPTSKNTRRNETGSQESLRRSLTERHSLQSLRSPKKLLGYAIIAASGLLFCFIARASRAMLLCATRLRANL